MASIQSNYEVTPFLQEGELKWMLKDKDQRQDPGWAQAQFGFCLLQGVIEKRPCNRSANNVNAPALPIPCSRASKCCFGVDGSLNISQGCSLGTRSHFLHQVSLVCPSWPTGECHHLCVRLALRVALLIKGVSVTAACELPEVTAGCSAPWVQPSTRPGQPTAGRELLEPAGIRRHASPIKAIWAHLQHASGLGHSIHSEGNNFLLPLKQTGLSYCHLNLAAIVLTGSHLAGLQMHLEVSCWSEWFCSLCFSLYLTYLTLCWHTRKACASESQPKPEPVFQKASEEISVAVVLHFCTTLSLPVRGWT